MTDIEIPPGAIRVLAVVRFAAELGLLAAFAWTGWRLGDPWTVSLALAVVLPLLAAAVWGRWVAPRSPRRLADPARLAVEVSLFALAFLGLVGTADSYRPALWGAVLWGGYLLSVGVGRKGW